MRQPLRVFGWAGIPVIGLCLALSQPASAVSTLYWGADCATIGGPGTWYMTTKQWNPASDGSGTWQTYVNDCTTNAVFGGATAGTVTLNKATYANAVDFTTTGYTLAAGGNQLSLFGESNIIVGSGLSATVSAVINATTLYKTDSATLGRNLGTLTLSANNSAHAGAIVLGAGTLVAGGNFAFGSGTVTLGDANTTTYSESPTLYIGGAYTIANAVTVADQSTPGTYTIGSGVNAGVTYSGPITLNQSTTFLRSGATANSLTLSGGIGSGNTSTKKITFSIPTGASAINVNTSGINEGAGKFNLLVTANAGTVNLNVADTYTGVTTVANGTLFAAASGALGSTSSIVLGDATTNNTLAKMGFTVPYTVTAPVTVADCASTGGYVLWNDGDTLLTVSSQITLNQDLSINQKVNNTGSNGIVLSGGIVPGKPGLRTVTFTSNNAGASNLYVNAAMSDGNGGILGASTTNGTTYFTCANSYSGPTTVGGANASPLVVTADGALGTTDCGTTVNFGPLLLRNVKYLSAEPLFFTGSGHNLKMDLAADGGDSTFNGPISVGTSSPDIGVVPGSSLTLNGTITGNTGTLTFNQDCSASFSGRVYLNGDASGYTGAVKVNSGIVTITNGGALGGAASSLSFGSNSASSTVAPAELRLAGGAGGFSMPQSQTGFKDWGIVRNVSGANSIPNGMQLRAEYVAGVNTNTVHLYVDNGSLSIGPTSNSGITYPVTMVLGGAGGGGGVGTFTGAISQVSATNWVGVTVNGATWDLNGTNTYSGPTLVTGGGTLGGTGSFLSTSITVNGGEFSPGASPGKMAVKSLAFTNSLDNCIIDIASATSYDCTLFKTTLALAGANLVVNDALYKPAAKTGDQFWIFYSDNSSSIPVSGRLSYAGFNLDNHALFTTPSGVTYQIIYNIAGSGLGSDSNVELITGAVAAPEPATLFLLGSGALGALGFIRRRRVK